MTAAAVSNMYTLVGGDHGPWRVAGMTAVKGPGLDPVRALGVVNEHITALPRGAAWLLCGFTSNVRYATSDELARLKAVQRPLDRPEASRAALIPIRKIDNR